MKVNYHDIEVNDTVYFETAHIDNFDLYWRVDEKLPGGMLKVSIHEMGQKDERFIPAGDVKYLAKAPKA